MFWLLKNKLYSYYFQGVIHRHISKRNTTMAYRTTILLLALMPILTQVSLQADEVIDFFPVAAKWDETKSCWEAEIHAVVYEPELNSLKRRALLALLTDVLDIDTDQRETDLFKARARHFLVDHERGKNVRIRLLDQEYNVGESQANGHTTGKIEFKDLTIDPNELNYKTKWHSFRAVMSQDVPRQFIGQVQCVPPRGVTIISDVDDTIKISDVTKRKELIKNTFTRPFRAVPGIAAQYQVWEKSGAAFHYLSASPWQLYLPLEEFREQEGFPRGVWSMKHLRFTDRSAIDFLKSQEGYKTALLKTIFADFPERVFVLIGDTGEQDPEIFGVLAREYPKQVRRIFIRESQTPATDHVRLAKAFDALSPEVWHVFNKPEELADKIPAEWFTNPPATK
jgi:phosphatidate phosphatase APP1